MNFDSFAARLLRRWLPYKDIGWKEIREEFTRFRALKTRWFSVLVHRIDAPEWHPYLHDHPWWFVSLILSGGYWERTANGEFWRRPGSVLAHRAEYAHNVRTDGVAWSVV